MSTAVSSIILAGGKSSRLGKDKAMLKLDGKCMMLWSIACKLATISNEVIIATDGRRYQDLDDIKVRWAADVYPGAGSLVGLYSGLKEARSNFALVVACDMPFVNLELLRYMISLPRDYAILLPKIGSGVEPLHAIYSKECLPHIENLLEMGHKKIRDLYPRVRIRYLSEEEIDKYDPWHRSFFNINTPQELAEAQELMRQDGSEVKRG